MIHLRPRLLLAPAMLAGAIAAQNTIPHWSTWFGSVGRDEGVVVLRGPGSLVTLVGHSNSSGLITAGGLATAGAFRTTNAMPGSDDVFIARFDPALPAGSQLQWCTYLGGSGDEFVFDADVDPATGDVTVVGLTTSPNFPGTAGTLPTTGPSDGFIARIDDQGATLLFSMLYGGAGNDHICEIEFVDRNAGVVAIAGVTDSRNLPSATNTYWGGGSDSFVARVVLSSGGAPVWSTYLGDISTDGWIYPTLFLSNPPAWVGNLDRMGMTLDANGDAVVATVSFRGIRNLSAYCPLQPTNAGGTDVYFARIDATGTETYVTFFGGAGDERPKAVLPHPAGGYVVAGLSNSSNLSTPGSFQPTPQGGCDGFLAWIEPSPCPGPSRLHYCTYLGGTSDDTIQALALERSGVATVVGYSKGGGFPTTPRCLQAAAGSNQIHGFVARLELSASPFGDLHHASLVVPVSSSSTAVLRSVQLDEAGDVWFAGSTTAGSYHLVNPFQGAKPGGRDAILTHMPLLPGGVPGVTVTRQLRGCATSCAGVTPYTGMVGAPVAGSTFGFTVADAPPSSSGAVVIGVRTPTCIPFLNISLLVSPLIASVGLSSDAFGYARLDVRIPPGAPSPPDWGFGTQWVFFTGGTCAGPLVNTGRLDW